MASLKDKLALKLQEDYTEEITIPSSVSEDSNVIPFRHNDAVSKDISILPTISVSISEAKERLLMLKTFVKEMLIPGEDFGVIPGCSKPSLLKPGAEKLCDVFGFSKHVEIINTSQDWEKGIFHFEVMVTLISKRTGIVEAQGVGAANSKEKRYKVQDSFSIVNTLLKMAKKRALVDAVLSATRSSGLFSQDIEDMHDLRQEVSDKGLSTKAKNKSGTAKPNKVNELTNVLDSAHTSSNTPSPLPLEPSAVSALVSSITREQLNEIFSLASALSLPIEAMKNVLKYRYDVNMSTELTLAQGVELISYLHSLSAVEENKRKRATCKTLNLKTSSTHL